MFGDLGYKEKNAILSKIQCLMIPTKEYNYR